MKLKSKTRVNMFLPDSLIELLDEEANKYNVSRTSYISFALSTYISNQNMRDTLSKSMNAISDMKNDGTLDSLLKLEMAKRQSTTY